MSQVPSHFETSVPAADSGETPPYSLAAIVSLISGLLFCIPGMMILGLICGIFGFFTTGDGARRGRGLAITGFLLSLLVTVGWVIGIATISPWINGTFTFAMEAPRETLTATFNGDTEEARKRFLDQTRPSAEEVKKFASDAQARWGAWQSVMVKDPGNGGAGGGSDFPMPISVTFDSGVVPGTVYFSSGDDQSGNPEDLAMFQSGNDFKSMMLIDRITLEPATGDPLTLGTPLRKVSSPLIDPPSDSGSESKPTEEATSTEKNDGGDTGEQASKLEKEAAALEASAAALKDDPTRKADRDRMLEQAGEKRFQAADLRLQEIKGDEEDADS
ncbi:MAG: hypothetical protein CMJ34_14070 [Phycisphaerae bacterium]|nr:hypothetical protein [Phycisphaerae bacterium]